MTDDPLNDNVRPMTHVGAARCEPHGRAAMLLVESLIHALIARSVIRVADAMEIAEVATAVEELIAIDRGELSATSRESMRLLAAISASLRTDLPSEPRSA